ncbi:MAG: Mur ligase family protein, partial [Christensenellaceae bacterium]
MIFTAEHILEWSITAVLMTLFLYLCSGKILGGLQQASYSTKRLFKWMGRKDNLLWTSLLLLTFMMCLIAGVIATCFVFFADPALLSLVVFPLFATIFFIADRKYALKVKTVYTARFIRLTVCYVFVLFVACLSSVTIYGALACVIDVYLVTNLRYVLLPLLVLCLPFLAAIANFLDQLYEVPRNASYLKKAQKRLAEANLIKIGITGSYGKTTVKNILASVLSEKYRVLVTPASYNTPLGIARSVNRNHLEDYDVFIAEMGARHTGDIAQLCETVRPDYSLITGICPQHLQSFGSVEAIVAAKGEILAGSSTGAVLGGDEYTLSLYENSPVETLIAGKDVKVSDVVATHEGTQFVLIVGKEKRTVRTKLLGRHTADNMCVAATMAHFMGMQIDEIVAGLEKVDYIPHRLQPIYEEDVIILDDSYNANVKGA